MRPWFAALLLLVCAAGAAPVRAQFDDAPDGPPDYPYDDPGDDAPDPGEYDQALRPYGDWHDAPGYGRFWRPRVGAGWRPYSDGQWVWTNYGWTWVSYEPWNWTLHYGRWSYLPTWGWGWFPGSVWGPAWVNWASYGGYVGWAPLSPWGRPRYHDYLFVRDYDFCAPHLRHRAFHYDRVPRHVLEHWHDHEGRRPDRHAIERVSRHPVRVLPDRPEHSLAPWQRDRARRGRDDRPLVHERRDREGPGRAPDHPPTQRRDERGRVEAPPDHGRDRSAERGMEEHRPTPARPVPGRPAPRLGGRDDPAPERLERQPRLGRGGQDRPRGNHAEQPSSRLPGAGPRPPIVRQRPAIRQDQRPVSRQDRSRAPQDNRAMQRAPAIRGGGPAGAGDRAPLVHRKGGDSGRQMGDGSRGDSGRFGPGH